jgi:murein DD-endopeptidase MepM/ murein hydrolase activator NlpD
MSVFYTGASGVGTGAHLDFRVHDVAKGGYVDPTDFQDILMTGGKPLTGQFQVTSPYGTRSRPVAGASTFHQGIDYNTPTGTPVNVLGGKYLTTFDDQRWTY